MLKKFFILILAGALAGCQFSQNNAGFKYIKNFKNSKLERLIVKNNNAIHSQNEKGNTLLQYAIMNGNIDAVKILLDNHVSINQISQSGETALVIAVEYGYYNIVKLMVEKYRADVHAVNSAGLNPAKAAYENQKVEILNFLLANGATKADMFSTATIENTQNAGVLTIPFTKIEQDGIVFIEKSDLDGFVNYIKENPILNFQSTDTNGNSLLHYAVLQENSEFVNLIIGKEKTLINAVNKDKASPLMIAAQTPFVDNARQLILQGANLKTVDKQQQTILHYAVKSNDLAMLNLILNNIPNPNLTDFLEVTPLDLAAQLGNAELTQRLLDSNADTSITTRDKGYTALHFAVESGNVDTVKILLKFNASKSAPDLEGKLPIDIASDMDLKEIKKLL